MPKDPCVFRSDNLCRSAVKNPSCKPVSDFKCEYCNYYKSLNERHRLARRKQILEEIKRLKQELRGLDTIV
jgi:hypothetical protein